MNHFFEMYNIHNVLCDKNSKKLLKPLNDCNYQLINLDKESVRGILISDITKCDEFTLHERYDLVACSSNNLASFQMLFHKATFIFVLHPPQNFVVPEGIFSPEDTACMYSIVSNNELGILYRNDYHSLTFETSNLTVYEQTYVRDKPQRFLKKVLDFSQNLIHLSNVVEIGSSRSVLNHDIEEINPICCNDSHSTFFWTRLSNAMIHTVDINHMCKTVIKSANNAGFLTFGENTRLKVHIQDGINFLTNYAKNKLNPSIDFLFLDAWDVGTFEYAESHLQAYMVIKEKLSDKCLISIDDTDLQNNGKGKLLLPVLLKDSFVILYKGRHTILYKNCAMVSPIFSQ